MRTWKLFERFRKQAALSKCKDREALPVFQERASHEVVVLPFKTLELPMKVFEKIPCTFLEYRMSISGVPLI